MRLSGRSSHNIRSDFSSLASLLGSTLSRLFAAQLGSPQIAAGIILLNFLDYFRWKDLVCVNVL
jgi:hypothetical protein